MAIHLNKTNPIALLAINLMPLIDVLFMLLIFFLVTTRFAKADREMDVDLPTATMARPVTEAPREILISIDQEGRYFVDSKIVTATELEDILKRAITNNPHQAALIRADKRVPFQFPVTAIDLCNRLGIRHTANMAGDE